MVKHGGILYSMTALFLTLIVFLCAAQGQGEILSFQITSGEYSHSVALWKNENGQYYVFLPSYAELEHVRVTVHTGNPVYLNDVELEDGMTCAPFSDGIAYRFSFFAWGRYRQGEITFLRSANVAAMYIDTQTGSMDLIHAEKGNRESGTMTLYRPDGTREYAGKIASIRGRGNSTWIWHEKKPYSIELIDEVDLLNLGSAQKWVLLANAKDPSHLRNKVIYDFAARAGLPYAPGSDWVDLYLNGEYAGLYLLCERNEVHPQRVNLADNGSFLVSMEDPVRLAEQNYPYVSTDAELYLRIHDPENPSSDQLRELKNIWQSVENAILAEDDRDPVTGKTWLEQIDLDSWVKKYLMEEIFGNVDACFYSQYFYCDGRDGERKIYAGPVWDYDQTMGLQSVWQLAEPNTLYANRYDVKAGYVTPWFAVLYQKDVFYERMLAVYQQDFLPLLTGFLKEYVEACGKQIAQAYVLDQVRWNLGTSEIREDVEYLQNFMQQRIAFLNRIWIEKVPYHMVKVDNAKGGNYGYYAVFSGETLRELPVFADTQTWKFLGWYDSDTEEAITSADPIYDDMTVLASWQEKPLFWIGRIAKAMPLLVLGILLLLLLKIDQKRVKMDLFRK